MMAALGLRPLLMIYAAAALLGWYAGQAEHSGAPLVQARRDDWRLAPLPMPADGTNLAVQVAAASIWGAEAKPAAAASAPEDDRWRIAGLYGRGRQAGVLVLFQDPAKPPQRLKVGDKLPTGESIQAVEGNEVVVRKGKKVERFGVEQREK